MVELVVAALLATLASMVAALAINVLTGGTAPWWLSSMQRFASLWLAAAVPFGAASLLWVWWAQRRLDKKLLALVPAGQLPESWLVQRPAEIADVARALCRRRGVSVGITTAIHGAGGLGL